jgi:hypothetical protein
MRSQQGTQGSGGSLGRTDNKKIRLDLLFHACPTIRKLTAKYAKYANPNSFRKKNLDFFRVFRVFRGLKIP